MANETNTHLHQLMLKISLQRSTVRLGEPVPVVVELVNQSQTEIVVNSRMGMGYPDSLDRELYCEILQEDGDAYMDYQAYMIDYRRKALGDAFFTTLAPGEGVASTFDLHQWYHLVRPGVYQIRVVYAPEPYEPRPEAVVDRIVSAPLTLTVQPAAS